MGTGARPARRVAAAVLTTTAMLAACHSDPRPSSTTSPPATQQRPQSTAASTSRPAPKPKPKPPSVRALVTRRLARIAGRLPAGSISVAARNTVTGASYHFGEKRGMWTGSVYKLLVLEGLLLRCQDDGTWLSDYELDEVTSMIENSDNKAGYQMYLDLGGSAALTTAARRLGLRHTRVGQSDPTFTTTGGRDGVTLLQRLVTDGPLDRQSRSFVLGLMRDVQADQRWGVGAVADRDDAFANKNGWLQVRNDNGAGEDDDRRWLVNSLGIVRVGGQRLLLAIFTEHDPDRDTGIRLVETLARATVAAVTSR